LRLIRASSQGVGALVAPEHFAMSDPKKRAALFAFAHFDRHLCDGSFACISARDRCESLPNRSVKDGPKPSPTIARRSRRSLAEDERWPALAVLPDPTPRACHGWRSLYREDTDL
jgi:hypothetical protein